MSDGYFEDDITQPLYNGMSVVHPALQILTGLGVQNILFCGVDLISRPNKNHFYDGIREKEERSAVIFSENQQKMISSMNASHAWISKNKPKMNVFRLSSQVASNNPFPEIKLEKFIKNFSKEGA